jgi:penicillin-binding protein 1C
MDSNNSNSNLDPAKRKPGGSDLPTKPGDRIRKILAANEDETISTPVNKEAASYQPSEQQVAGLEANSAEAGSVEELSADQAETQAIEPVVDISASGSLENAPSAKAVEPEEPEPVETVVTPAPEVDETNLPKSIPTEAISAMETPGLDDHGLAEPAPEGAAVPAPEGSSPDAISTIKAAEILESQPAVTSSLEETLPRTASGAAEKWVLEGTNRSDVSSTPEGLVPDGTFPVDKASSGEPGLSGSVVAQSASPEPEPVTLGQIEASQPQGASDDLGSPEGYEALEFEVYDGEAGVTIQSSQPRMEAEINQPETPTQKPEEDSRRSEQMDLTGAWSAEFESTEEENPTQAATAQGQAPQPPTAPSATNPPAGEAPTIPQPPLVEKKAGSLEDTAPVILRRTHPDQLPKQVDQVDLNATRVTRAAYGQNPPARPAGNVPQPAGRRPGPPSYGVPTYTTIQKAKPQVSLPKSKPRKKGLGCFWKGVIGILFVGVLVVVAVLSFLVYKYYSIAATLPNVSDLKNRASQFETTRILDRNGNTIYEIMDPNAGLRTAVTLDKISPYLIAATLSTEDKDFYSHPGFDIVALLRALYQNYSAGTTVSGASTITQQLAKMLLLSPTEAAQQTVERKAREIILAAELTRQYTKEEILEIYLNEINYGNFSYGIEAAAETYFNTTASKLTLGQAAFLAGIPQAPSVYDIFTNRTQTLERFRTVIMLAYTLSQERNCIYVSTNIQKVCVDAVSVAQALDEIEKQTTFTLSPNRIKDPHWVTYIRSLLEAQYDPQTLYRSGFTVYTTLDQNLQDLAESIVQDQIKALADKKVSDGALVAVRPETGEILAMVGSADFYNDQISGQVNMAISPRQPGSSIKPLTYAAAFEKGWTPSTVIWDVPSDFPPSGDPNDTRAPYVPVNYDGKFHGPVTVRTALANSYNIPAVKALQFVGVYDNPNTPGQDGLISFAKKMGITTLTRSDYGLALTLGGGDVSLLEMTSAFSVFANQGQRMPPFAISKIVDHNGTTVFENKHTSGDQVLRPEHAFLITSILSDNAARTPAFGPNSVLNLPFPAAAKTGTTNDFRDNWTMGYTPDLAVGVWVGNADYTPMVGTTGVTGAAPIWSAFMKAAIPLLTDNKPSSFTRPSGIVERAVCTLSGTEPSQWCPSQRGEFFAADQLPLPKEQDFWQKVKIDTWTGYRASAACADFTEDKFALNVTDPTAVKWIKNNDPGKKWAKDLGFTDPIFFSPSRDCKQDDSRPQIIFSAFRDGDTITTAPLDIYAVVDATSGFKEFKLEYGIGDKPVDWKQLGDVIKQPAKQPTKIYSWDMKDLPSGKFTLRIHLTSDHDTYAEKSIVLVNQVATPTPTATSTATSTATPSNTPTITATITPTVTATPLPNTVTPTVTLPPPPPPA